MRWGRGTLRFARPLRWLCVLHGDTAVEVELEGDLRSGRTSRGHRFLSGGEGTAGAPVQIASADSYVEQMRAAFVLVDDRARRDAIVAGLDAHPGWSDPARVLDEVVDLGEWPSVMRGSFAPEFLELPPRVIVTAMQSHQRYFPLAEPDAALVPAFLFVSNGASSASATIVAGNERVLRGRLDDARFAYRRDLETGLEAMAAATARIAYHARAGSIADRTARHGDLIAQIAAALGVDPAAALAAARLAKADLGSTLVGEFAELQGHVGAVYARAEGVDEAVANAIEEHYRPVAAGGELPESEAGALLALADRLDALAVAFAVGEQPTGSRDPYGLRRAAAGVAAITLAREWAVDIGAAVRLSHWTSAAQGAELSQDAGETAGAVTDFVLDRVDAMLDAEGVAYDLVRCARGAHPTGPVAHARLARALAQAADSQAFADVHTAYMRCHRLAAKGASEAAPALVADAFTDDAERALAQALVQVGAPVREAATAFDFAAALERGAALRAPVDAFFDAVLVMHADDRVRANRLRLLVDVTSTLGTLGDFSEVAR
jgi:glycyl-tRNA synthetase beta chain